MVSYSGYGIISGYTNDGTRIIDERVSLYYDKVGRTKNYEFKDDNYNLKLRTHVEIGPKIALVIIGGSQIIGFLTILGI